MKIELGYYEIAEALQSYVEKTYNLNIDFEETEVEIKYRKAFYKPLKHKNGKVQKHPVHGYELNTIDRWENRYITLGEDCELQFFLEHD